jgi:rSAM/selenodomain-associated transferase 2/rSAM/selenodomain-associated transferase 1
MVNDPPDCVLVIFCRRPTLGIGKQRIAAELGQPAALHIAHLLLAATIEDTRSWPGKVILAPANREDVSWAKALIPEVTVIPQPEGNLGQRINHVDTLARSQGARKVLFVGSDAPGMEPDDLTAAATSLNTHDAVFIPAADGGITLMGATKSWPTLGSLAWETSELFAGLLTRCESVGWNCATLATGFDVDTQVDLVLATKQLENDERPARQALCQWINSAELEHLETPYDTPRPDSISVVIPVYGEAQELDRLLSQLADLSSPIDEILVVDGAAISACRDTCAQHDVSYYQDKANRGAQMHFGSTLARSDILWFLHVDATPPLDAAQSIHEHLALGHSGGYFKFEFGGKRRWYKQLLAAAINLRTRVGVPYSDQGIFVRQRAYCAAGGFAPEPLFEEVPLVRNLRRMETFAPMTASIDVAPRRWERDGWLRRSLKNRMLAVRYMLGASPAELAKSYQPELKNDFTD